MTKRINPPIAKVKEFWNRNPLCAHSIPHELGSKEYFEYYNLLREKNESLEFSYKLHEYKNFGGKKVLDIGCGNGYVLSKYAKEGAEVYGIDITETSIDLCNKRFEYLSLNGNFQVANAEELPFSNNSFDCVCSMGVLHHVPDTEKAVNEIHRVLKPGGRIILMFYYKDSWYYRVTMPILSILLRKSRQQLVNEVDGVGNPKGDVYSKNELDELLLKFKNKEYFAGLLQGWMIIPKIGKILPDFLFRPLAKRWGWFIYIKANK